ncbi:MAG TPA: thioredoxin domain-containing protein [Pyrinomonadaceae bacterium]|nr:thioredoxin domain-containing protein [Pyrinomonadaceae bacterium]
MKRYLPLIIIAGVLAVALGAGLVLWRSSKQDASTTQPFAETTPTPTPIVAQTPTPNASPTAPPVQAGLGAEHFRGGANAKVTLEEYGDYQCPPCGGLFQELKTIEKEYGNQIRFVFRHFPLQGHRHAMTAARAAEAAGLQGHFWEMHDMIYQNQLSWSPVDDARSVFIQYAANLNLDVARFTRDMDSQEVAARVNADYARGSALGIEGTPAVFVNGRQMNPNAVTSDGIRLALDYVLGKRR